MIIVIIAIALILFTASVVVPWACEHDGESWVESFKRK